MAKFSGFNILKYLTIGLLGGILVLFISWIFNTFSIPTYFAGNKWISFTAATVDVDLRQQLISGGNYNAVGVAFTNFLASVNVNIMTMLNVILGSIIVLLVGRIIVGWIPNVKGNMRVLLSYIIGGIALGIYIAATLKLNFLNAVLSIGLFSLLTGIVLQIIINAKTLKYLSE